MIAAPIIIFREKFLFRGVLTIDARYWRGIRDRKRLEPSFCTPTFVTEIAEIVETEIGLLQDGLTDFRPN
jgi:hypothetical protein